MLKVTAVLGLLTPLVFGAEFGGPPCPPGPSGTVFVTERQVGSVAAYDAATGDVLWTAHRGRPDRRDAASWNAQGLHLGRGLEPDVGLRPPHRGAPGDDSHGSVASPSHGPRRRTGGSRSSPWRARPDSPWWTISRARCCPTTPIPILREDLALTVCSSSPPYCGDRRTSP